MDGSAFAAFSRLLAPDYSRRALSRFFGGLALAGTIRLLDPAAAPAKHKKHKKACPPCTTRQHGKCKQLLPDGTACPGGTCQRGSCVGSVPCCGGNCPRCANGQPCSSADACLTATCVANVCQNCTGNLQSCNAPNDCYCQQEVGTTRFFCHPSTTPMTEINCAVYGCPPGAYCFEQAAGQTKCFRPCAAP